MANVGIFELKKEGNIGVVTINVPGQPMNTWTEDAISAFLSLLDDLENASDLKGVVFISGKTGNFHAGADLNMLNKMTGKEDTAKGLDIFHSAFKRLEALGFPTMAAIEGHCLGGGMEFALACTARIAKDSRLTQIGLPECSLGIFPGAGGTQRLPRLIGMAAIEPILRGTILPAVEAQKIGIIDRLVTEHEDLSAEAKKFLEEIISGKQVIERPAHDFTPIDAVAEMARQGVLKTTRGRVIPGPMLAIKSMQDGLKVSLAEGLEIEKNNFVEAVLSNQAKGSIHTFFLKTMSDKPRSLMSKGFQPTPIKKVAILGFGTMGRGIAIDVLRGTQIPVVVKDVAQALEPGKAFVKKILDGMAQKNKLKAPVDDLMNRLIVTSEYGDEFKDVNLVIEAVFEDIKIKEQVYGEICKTVSDTCIIATNTSSIPMDSMAAFVTGPERFAGLHFFSPVWMMQLVEIVRGAKTSQETVDNLLNFVDNIRKRPVICRDNPGFVVNAVLFPYFLSAMEFLEAGNTIEEIDKAFVQFGMPVGPIRLTDEVGIDVCFNVLKGRGLRQDTLRNLVEAGRLGLKKSGKGFFLADGTVDPDVLSLIPRKAEQKATDEEMQSKVLTHMITVGKDLLDRSIVDDPRMIDLGMIWGTGFPADRGGPLKWGDLTGLSKELFGKTFYGA
ncbi:MAG: enoyl-CoA hydratase/isomerase family protein [Desulfomonile tiedjei]|uniref:Enoyl-CoA hydratase/isomerase family protein n=1 Tax=Desulfomonile tiedjei TaxID=2358 RepID=A0A9D6V538_9BACT|nr:enoyl-CoA hydratase/isomerase family protein [Desulfomonile tiedjei]